jgi:hypothetical protein
MSRGRRRAARVVRARKTRAWRWPKEALGAAWTLAWSLRPSARFFLLAGLLGVLWACGVPHLRWEYTYADYGDLRVYRSCEYVGIWPFALSNPENCPFLAFVKTWKE